MHFQWHSHENIRTFALRYRGGDSFGEYALVTCLDSSREVVEIFGVHDIYCAVIGTQALLDCSTWCVLATEPNLFNGFDEVWFLTKSQLSQSHHR